MKTGESLRKETSRSLKCHCVVIGGGIAGMESAVTLADMGFDVALVEKEASIGGKMILLSKVFPTLDCSSCISTPKMAAVANHPRITLFTYSNVKSVKRDAHGFRVRVVSRNSYVDPQKCTGCSQCETVCTVARPDQFNDGMIARRAIYIPFPQSVPKKAVIEKKGLSPCSQACPAGIRAHGIVSLARAGKFREAAKRHLEDSPFPAALSCLCYAPCENRCTKGKTKKGAPIPIKGVSSLMANGYYGSNDQVAIKTAPDAPEKRVAVMDAGPAGLSAAYHLALNGYEVTVFTKDSAPGGILAEGVPEAGLSRELVAREIDNVIGAGVIIDTDTSMTPEEAGRRGFAAALAPVPWNPDLVMDPVVKDGIVTYPELVDRPYLLAHAIGWGRRAAVMVQALVEKRNSEDALVLVPALRREKIPAKGSHYTVATELSEENVQEAVSGCLDCGVCSECRQCVKVCPGGAIDLAMKPSTCEIDTDSVVLATGFRLFDPARKPLLGYSRYPNVITAMQMDRLLSPTRPYNALLRPSDGKIPGNIAFVLCTGSRDVNAGNPRCSRICCMYSIKQAQLIMGALPISEVTIYYIDIRAFGKGYDEFFQQAEGMGTHFVKGKVVRVEEVKDQNLRVHFEDMEGKGGLRQANHDLVVLSVGAMSNPGIVKVLGDDRVEQDELSYIREVDGTVEPGRTSVDGIFVAGAASGPKDIPDSVVHAGAASAQAASYLIRTGALK